MLLAALLPLVSASCSSGGSSSGWGQSAPPKPPAALPPATPSPRAVPQPAPPVVAAAPVVEPAPPPVRRTLLDTLFAAYPAWTQAPVDTFGAARWTDDIYRNLTDRQRAMQLVMASIPAGSSWARVRTEMLALAREGVGGFLVPRAWDPSEVFRAATELQNAAPVPLLLAADYERGVGRPGNRFTEFPAAMAFGAAGDPTLAGVAGRLTALESRAIGVHLVFAPVVDVNTEPNNPIINNRAYSERADDVARMAGAYVAEAERLGVLTTLKHFPGHADTEDDTHARLAVARSGWDAMQNTHLLPYRRLFAAPTPPSAVMVAHVAAPSLETGSDNIGSGTGLQRSATLSPAIVTDLLRRRLGFDGLVVTDDVQMGALAGLSEAERAVRPVVAGVDLVLTPRNARTAGAALLDAVETGRISRADFAAHVRRVLRAKGRAGLHRRAAPDAATFSTLDRDALGRRFAEQVAARSATLLKVAPNTLPVEGRVLLVQVSNVRAAGTLAAGMDAFSRALGATVERRFDGPTTIRQALDLRTLADGFDVVVVAAHFRLVSGRGDAGLRDGQRTLIQQVLGSNARSVVAGFGNPYALADFADADALLLHYDSTLPSAQSAGLILRGHAVAPGRLPVTLRGFPYGSGGAGY